MYARIRAVSIWLAALALAPAAGAEAEMERHKGYEQAPYKVRQAGGAVEIRDYAPFLAAEVTVRGDRATAANRGFRVLAGYIFGGSETAEKVEMTVPVTQAPASASASADGAAATVSGAEGGAPDLWVVRFVMPAGYTMETLPKPRDDRIRFVEVPAQRQAVLRFPGVPTQALLARREAELRAWLEAAGLRPRGPAIYHFYDAPFTLPWNRRNEVAFLIDTGG